LNGGVIDARPARRTARRLPRIFVVDVLVVAAIAAIGGFQHLVPSSAMVATPFSTDVPGTPSTALPPIGVIPRERRGALGKADGLVPANTTVFADGIPAVANLDPALLAALREAATDAADAGIELDVNSGWRSPAYQEQLLRDAISQYGSEAEAARWVGSAATSAHVSGDAVDLGPAAALAWLSRHGARYGLCQIYRNEPWHYELRVEAIHQGCPAMYADPTRDPRMQR
jgi:hypothetical protein